MTTKKIEQREQRKRRKGELAAIRIAAMLKADRNAKLPPRLVDEANEFLMTVGVTL